MGRQLALPVHVLEQVQTGVHFPAYRSHRLVHAAVWVQLRLRGGVRTPGFEVSCRPRNVQGIRNCLSRLQVGSVRITDHIAVAMLVQVTDVRAM